MTLPAPSEFRAAMTQTSMELAKPMAAMQATTLYCWRMMWAAPYLSARAFTPLGGYKAFAAWSDGMQGAARLADVPEAVISESKDVQKEALGAAKANAQTMERAMAKVAVSTSEIMERQAEVAESSVAAGLEAAEAGFRSTREAMKVVSEVTAPKPKAKKAKAQPKSAPMSEPKLAPKSEPVAKAKVAPKTEAPAKPKAASKASVKPSAAVQPKAETKVSAKPVAPAAPKVETKVSPKPEGVTKPKTETYTPKGTPNAAAVTLPSMPEPKAASKTQKPALLKAARKGGADDLKLIKGVGPKLEDTLNEMGVYHFDQIAKWSTANVSWMDDNLDGVRGRVSRDDWVSQASILAKTGKDA